MPVKIKSPVPSDIEIAQEAEMLPITKVAEKAGILDEELELHGRYPKIPNAFNCSLDITSNVLTSKRNLEVEKLLFLLLIKAR